MISDSKLRQMISQFLAGEVSLEDFEDRLVQDSWNMHANGSSKEAQQIVSQVELLLAEHSSGHRDLQQLRSALKPLVEFQNVSAR